MSRRAKLRRQAISEMRDPETTGNLERTENLASLVWTGGGIPKSAAKFAPKGFKLVKGLYKPSKDFLEALGRKAHKLKPVLGKIVKR